MITIKELREAVLYNTEGTILFLKRIGEEVGRIDDLDSLLMVNSLGVWCGTSNFNHNKILSLGYLQRNFLNKNNGTDLKSFPKRGFTRTDESEFKAIESYLSKLGLRKSSGWNTSSIIGISWNEASMWVVQNYSSYPEYLYKDLEKFLTKPKDFRMTKIWINHDSTLAKLVHDRLGYYGHHTHTNYPNLFSADNFKGVAWFIVDSNGKLDGYTNHPHKSKIDWNINSDKSYREITLTDLGLESYNQGIPVTSNGKTREDLVNKMISIGESAEDFKRLQTELFSLGFKWSNSGQNLITPADKYKTVFISQTGLMDLTNSNSSIPIYEVISKPKLDLINTKIWIGDNLALSIEVQKKLFSMGVKWSTNDTKVNLNDNIASIFIYPSNGKDYFSMTFSEKPNQKDHFSSHINKEITIEELFGNPFPISDLLKHKSLNQASKRWDGSSNICSEIGLPKPSELRIEIVLEDQAEVQEPLNIVLEEQKLTLKF